MSTLTQEQLSAIALHVELTAHYFVSAYKVALALGVPKEVAASFAQQLLASFLTPISARETAVDLSALMARLTPGGQA